MEVLNFTAEPQRYGAGLRNISDVAGSYYHPCWKPVLLLK